MNKAPHDRPAAPGAVVGLRSVQRLPYVVELWNIGRSEPERVIARAATLGLARSILRAAAKEHPHRRIVLRKGQQVIEATA